MMVEKKRGLETLEVWQKAIEYAVEICQNVIPLFPSDEKWALSSQLRRAAQSIPANIAEGYGRYNYQEAIRFCYIARGSMAETKTHLVLANRLGYLDDTTHQDFLARLSEIGKMLNGYIKHLRKQKEMSYLHEAPNPPETYDLS